MHCMLLTLYFLEACMAQQKETAIDDIRTFLGTCVVPVTEKLVSYLEDLGITEIEDFRELNEDDLNEEKTGTYYGITPLHV